MILQRGCELALFQPRKVGNMDCTFCLDCVHACPHDNIGVTSRVPAAELMIDPIRSGIGYFSRRKDIAALAIVFSFGALLNAFGMVSPVYALEAWMRRLLSVSNRAPVLGNFFVVFLVVEPAILARGAAWLTRVLGGSKFALVPLAVRYSYALVPLGFGMWLAHYGFHFFTGILTIIPVTQAAVRRISVCIYSGRRFGRGRVCRRDLCSRSKSDFSLLGFAGSLLVVHHLAEEDCPSKPMRAFIPWAAVCLLVWFGIGLADVSAHGNARNDNGRLMERIRPRMKGTGNYRASRALLAWLSAGLLSMFGAPRAAAHNGPPFPIITDQRVGPYIISLWTHPDLGTGTFFVMVDPVPGGTVPKDLKIQIGVQPASGRLAEVVYSAWPLICADRWNTKPRFNLTSKRIGKSG